MVVSELIEWLELVPQNAEVTFLCPDGFNDSVEDVELEGGAVTLSGYATWLVSQRQGGDVV